MDHEADLYMKAKKLCLSTESVLDKRMYGEKLTASQCYMLHYIWTCHPKGTFATCLHKELGISMATISGCIKRLRQKGYLVIEACPGDERQKKLVPTNKLKRISGKLKTAIEAAEASVYGNLSDQERKLLFELEQKALEGAAKPLSCQTEHL